MLPWVTCLMKHTGNFCQDILGGNTKQPLICSPDSFSNRVKISSQSSKETTSSVESFYTLYLNTCARTVICKTPRQQGHYSAPSTAVVETAFT